MVLIGLLGLKKSGKSTLANYLINNYQFVEFSFANCLKRACQELFLLSDEQINGTQEQKETADERWFGCSPRQMLQFVGTDLLRENLDKIMPGLGKDIFIHHFKIWYQKELENNPKLNVVISDVRFQNEVDAIHELCGEVIKINRSNIISNDMHSSELDQQKINNYDHLINNDDTVEILYDKLIIIMIISGAHDVS